MSVVVEPSRRALRARNIWLISAGAWAITLAATASSQEFAGRFPWMHGVAKVLLSLHLLVWGVYLGYLAFVSIRFGVFPPSHAYVISPVRQVEGAIAYFYAGLVALGGGAVLVTALQLMSRG